jgi:hypothetical protein
MLRRAARVRTDVSEKRITVVMTLVFLLSVLRSLVTANVRSSPILITLMTEAIRYSKTSVITRVTRRNIPEDDIPHSYCRENLKF